MIRARYSLSILGQLFWTDARAIAVLERVGMIPAGTAFMWAGCLFGNYLLGQRIK